MIGRQGPSATIRARDRAEIASARLPRGFESCDIGYPQCEDTNERALYADRRTRIGRAGVSGLMWRSEPSARPSKRVDPAAAGTADRNEIKRHSKAGRVPILKIEEHGRSATVWDSLAICENARRAPSRSEAVAGRSRSRARGALLRGRDASDFPTCAINWRWTLPAASRCRPLREETRAQLARIVDSWTSALTRFGRRFLFGGLSIADCSTRRRPRAS